MVAFSGGKDSAAMLLRLLEMEQEAIERGERVQHLGSQHHQNGPASRRD